MLISNGSALNILLANNNRVLNDALKEADNKTLNNLLKQDSSNSSSSTNTAASSILKEVLNSIKDGTKSNSSLENILKNSTAFKDLGNLSSNLSSLLESIKDDESLQKFKPLLENFLKNIKDVTPDNLKEQIKNSGIFLENKLSSNPNAKLENLLQNISNLLKTIDTPEAKNSSQIIDNILKNIPKDGSLKGSELLNNLKTLVSSLQNLSSSLNSNQTQTLNNLANELKNFIQNGSMIESKTENLVSKILTQTQTSETENINSANNNIKSLINNQVKELLTQIKQDLTQNQNIIHNKNILPLIDKLISLPDIFSKSEAILNSVQNSNISNFSNNFATNLNPLLTALKESLQAINPKNIEIQNQINSLIKKVENIIQEYTNNQLDNPKDNQKLDNDFKSILLKMQDEVAQKTDIKSQDSLKTINNLLTQIDMQQLTSLVSNSNFVYIPFFWEMLEDGTVEIKQKEEDKFFCQIKLTLKDFGKIDLMLSMYDENKLDMTIYAQREHFKVTLRDNLQKLKLALNEANIIPMHIKLLDMKEESENKEQKPTNVYQNNYNNDFITSSRIDIKA
ncbi:flagellar hook-length control protein FliK [Aliarcobacter cryaerophilus]|uniref:Flagellar hook-length control protein FliK n=2 Tax=unclassified Arcobacter TaxID=2593671 RepID=A0AA96CSZ0_9BACT|nr:flagellar hook-length control protein FliK [Arcobacter sp. AZ-2023]WPD10225.1 flagellar hook-length control protein FliK [Arcobacter sp. DSM 115954]WNL15055.1 flagellar hook-length control protein FliK [Arcobacter sp. AZ-2023]WNL19063.1 flagellar hook-length control protein FliK [Arcobacter sp. AZ-2023]WNL21202.1 flagellar hook-length control protein FliK [Arcobacter sp. AZ-2023]